LTLHHAQGNAKFLERPGLEHLKDLPARITRDIKTTLGA
jgi:hypothetical protein